MLLDAGVQIIWQTGKNYELRITNYELEKRGNNYELRNTNYESGEPNVSTFDGIWCSDFITRMDYAYTVADMVVSRAGACTLSELCLLKKAALLVPSPNVAEDHQTMNARTLSDSNAAVLIHDKDAEEQLVPAAIELLKNNGRLSELSENIALYAQHNSAKRIVDEVIKIIS